MTRLHLDVRGVYLRPRDADEIAALHEANGGSLDHDAAASWALRIFLAVLAAVLVSTCAGCAALAGAGPVLQATRDVARAGCAILQATDGSSGDVLAASAAIQRSILEAQAGAAVDRGADRATIEAQVRTIAALAEALRVASSAIVEAGGNGPARLTPCPVAAPIAP